ncbi:hypothetical protein [Streptomyces indicus]|uniref:Uncharacterized protein n=1 Tax=Streptomyces indicus TaxID=417292 RepID=A0A1G8YJH7_9ACTN|nr:hypothetical protein [Streptomyces indicus]SDK02797.1 hypothetical protein SAMN05421806_10495 [Streptomyces indicus]
MTTVDWSRAVAGILVGLLLVPLLLQPLALLTARIVRRRPLPPTRAQRRARAELAAVLDEFAEHGGR